MLNTARWNFENKLAWAGALVLALALAFLEWRQPFYFTQDDNYVQFLPNVLVALDGAFAGFRLPLLNPYQFAGAPSIELGYYSLSYPPTYFSYALARWGLGDKTLTFDKRARRIPDFEVMTH